ncbi:MAG: DUF5666 domain-containing protein [Methylophilaceae bacterium]
MNKKLYLAFFYSGLLLLCTTVYARSNTCNEGIGGTGITNEGYGGTGISIDREGFGGTGLSAQGYGGTGVTNDGFGGTGTRAEGYGGTGIAGIITGFASVCVNGVEAHFDSKTQVDIDGATSSIDKLNVGDFAIIDAKGQGAEVSAQRISVIHALVGKIEAVNAKQNQLTIIGQTVQLNTATIGASNLKLGQNVAVSGLVNAKGLVIAMRTDVVADNVPSSVAGKWVNGKVSGVPVSFSNKTAMNSNIQATGQWDGKTLLATDVKQNAMDRVMRSGYAFNSQGFIYQAGNTQSIYSLGNQVYLHAGTRVYGDKNTPNAMVIVRGQIDKAGRIVAKDIEYSPVEHVLERGGSKDRPSSTRELDKSQRNATESGQKKNDIERSEKHEHDKSNANEKPENIQGSGKIKKLEKIDKVESIEKVEKPEKVEKVEKIEKVERVEKVEKIEIPERVEVPEKPEKYTY